MMVDLIAPADRRSALMYLPDGIAPWPDQTADWVLAFWRVMTGARDDGSRRDRGRPRARRAPRPPTRHALQGRAQARAARSALASPQPVVLMDEPFDGLDLRQTRATIAMFRELARGGRSLVLSIHSMPDAARVCDRLVLLNDGSTIAEGTLAELRELAGVDAMRRSRGRVPCARLTCPPEQRCGFGGSPPRSGASSSASRATLVFALCLGPLVGHAFATAVECLRRGERRRRRTGGARAGIESARRHRRADVRRVCDRRDAALPVRRYSGRRGGEGERRAARCSCRRDLASGR